MFSSLARAILGSANDRVVRRLKPAVQAINNLESSIQTLGDDELAGKTIEFRGRLEKGEPLDNLLPEAFAVVREAARRAIGLRPFDVQLMGGMVLHEGRIAEMRTGEGKTLVATLPAYLNALSGKGVHVVTVNDYLARRDAEWMGRVFRFLGLTVDCITHGMDDGQRQAAYRADITYATNNELGFDYLRDNMKFSRSRMVQRPLHFAIVDEVDSILIDEARTPLIISGPAESSVDLYHVADALIKTMNDTHMEVDEKHRSAMFTEEGQEYLEKLAREKGCISADSSLYDLHNIPLLHHCQQAMRAHRLFEADRDYIVKDNKVIIIDEFTGRMMEGRRYSDGLHQALEAKEKVEVQLENQTLASITFQNYFRLYDKLAGMTGTALTEEAEFQEIYKLGVVDMPTHVPVQRLDENDEVYRTIAEKNQAIVQQIVEANKKQQPVLVGTVSISKSEELSAFLKKEKIPHQVLNARYHEQEAAIIAQAGRPGAVTIATNMAGRGTDIQLGGNLDMMLAEAGEDAAAAEKIRTRHALDKKTVLEAGGLYVIGTERHESRRIDNQLRGRSGRQGDPGRSRFFLSLQDDLMRIFGSERLDGILKTLGLKEGEPIVHPWLSKSIERAQQKVEARNFEVRKTLLKYDDVMNAQRTVIYEQRRDIMDAESVRDTIDSFRSEVVSSLVRQFTPKDAYQDAWDVPGLAESVRRLFGLDLPLAEWAAEEGVDGEEIGNRLEKITAHFFEGKRSGLAEEVLNTAEKSVLLQTLDQCWKEHLASLDQLKQGINLRAYGQKDPLNEYKREAFEYFDAMLERLREQTIETLSHIEIRAVSPDELTADEADIPMMESRGFMHGMEHDADPMQGEDTPPASIIPITGRPASSMNPADASTWGDVPRNAACPCGSGKKYKHCHGKLA